MEDKKIERMIEKHLDAVEFWIDDLLSRPTNLSYEIEVVTDNLKMLAELKKGAVAKP